MTEIGPSESNIGPVEGPPSQPVEGEATEKAAPVSCGLGAIADQLMPESALLDADYLTQVFDAALPKMPQPQLADDPAVRQQQETSSVTDIFVGEFGSELEAMYDELIDKYVPEGKQAQLRATMKWDRTSGEEMPEELKKVSDQETDELQKLGGYLKVIGTLIILARRIINKSQAVTADDLRANIADRKANIEQIRSLSKQLVKEMEKIHEKMEKSKMWGQIMQYVSLGVTAITIAISAIILVAAIAAFCFSSGTLTVVCIAAISFAVTMACSSVTITDLAMSGALSQKCTDTVQDFVSKVVTFVEDATGLDETAAKAIVYLVIAAVIIIMIAAIILFAIATKGAGGAEAGSKAGVMVSSAVLLNSTQVMVQVISMTNVLHRSIAEVAKAAGISEVNAEWIAVIVSALSIMLLTIGGTSGAVSVAGLIGKTPAFGRIMMGVSVVSTAANMATTAASIPPQIQQGLIQMDLAKMKKKKGDVEAELAFVREFAMKIVDMDAEAIHQAREAFMEIAETLIKGWTGMIQKYSTSLSQLYGA